MKIWQKRLLTIAICEAWGLVTLAAFSCRVLPQGFIFDVGGSSAFPTPQYRELCLGFLNSKLSASLLKCINPTVNTQVGDLKRLPFKKEILTRADEFAQCVKEMETDAKSDWDNFETSWDFRDQPLLRPGLKGMTLEASWQNWETQSTAAIRRMQELETENNRLFIEAYGLQDELSPEVPEEQITLARADRRKDMAAFLSYAIGCMMGRYSLDAPGLILADAGATVEDYWRTIEERLKDEGRRMKDEQEAMQNAENFNLHTSSFIIHNSSFILDQDGILPLLDGEWFEDDIVARTREFLRATFDEVGLRDNIRFIEESLGKDLRKYFLTDFYKDHLQTYKKRPIYWLVQSPKKGFSVLIYLHRYTKDTMNLVLNRYLRPYQEKLRNRLAQLEQLHVSESVSTRDKTTARKESDKLGKILHECEEWERQTLLPLAQQRIELDLDDGVKVNYLKLGEALAPIPGLSMKDEG